MRRGRRHGATVALTGPPHFQGNPRNAGCMEEAAPDREPDNGSGKGDTSGQSPAAGGSVAVAAPPADALDAGGIQLPVWAKALGWSSTTTTAIAVTAVAQARCWRDMCRGYREPGRPRSTVQEPAIEGPGLHTRPDDALRTGAGVRACSHHASPARSRV